MNHLTPIAVVNRYFDALATGDVPGAMSLLSPQVVWTQPGANRFSGQHTGPTEVGTLIGGMMEISAGTFQLSVAGTPMSNGELVGVPVRFSGQREGASMDMSGIDLLTIREGLIVAVHLFSEDSPAEDVFWGKA